MERSLSFFQGNGEMDVGEQSFSFTTGIKFQNGMKLSFVLGNRECISDA